MIYSIAVRVTVLDLKNASQYYKMSQYRTVVNCMAKDCIVRGTVAVENKMFITTSQPLLSHYPASIISKTKHLPAQLT